MHINVALDIDGVLACRRVGSNEQAQFFKNQGAIITAKKTYYVFPGVIQLIKLLFQTEDIKVSFFSAGKKERNELFVEELLKLALTPSKYEDIKHKLRILSRNDLISASLEERQTQMKIYDILPGRKQKDLSKILCEGELLEHAILIENDITYVACGQAKNVLLMPSNDNYNFRVLSSKCKVYQPEGYKFLGCVLVSEASCHAFQKIRVEEGKQILLLKTKNEFEIGFLDKESHQYKQETISLKDNEELIEELNKIHQNQIEKSQNIYQIQDQELIKTLCHLVGVRGGLMKKICRRANRIFYVTGLLFTALKQSKSQGIPITEFLLRLQFKLQDNNTYTPRFRELRKIDDLYLLGLEKLREIKSDLQLMTPHHYVECIKLPLLKEEQLTVDQALVTQDDECWIM